MSLPTPDIYYPLHKDTINYNNQVQNWTSGSPVYDASVYNAYTYISKDNYKAGKGSLEFTTQRIVTFPSSNYTITSTPSGVGISVSSNQLKMVICNWVIGGLYYSSRLTTSSSWGAFTLMTRAPTNTTYYRIALSLDGTRGVVCINSGYVYMFNWTESTPSGWLQTLDNTSRTYTGISMTESKNTIVACDNYNIYYSTWNGSNNYNVFTTIINQYGIGICISPDGSRFIYGNGNSWYLYFWNGTNLTNSKKITSSGGNTRTAYFNADASIVVFTYQGSTPNMEVGSYNSNTQTYDSFITIPSSLSSTSQLDCHGFCMVDDGTNVYCYLYPLSGTIIYNFLMTYKSTPKMNPYISSNSSYTSIGGTLIDSILSCALPKNQLRFVWADYNNLKLYYTTRTSITSTWATPATFHGSIEKNFSIVQLTPDGSRGVTCAGWNYNTNYGYVYYFTWNSILQKYNNIVQTLDANTRDYRGLSITADGSRMVACSTTEILVTTWNGTNYNAFTRTLHPVNPSPYFVGMGISSNGDRIVYGCNTASDKNWYISFWNGTNYNDGTIILTRTSCDCRIPVFNPDASILFLSYSGNASYSVEYGFSDGHSNYTNFTPIPTSILPASLNSHGLYYIEDGINSNLYVLHHNLKTLYIIPFYNREQYMISNKSITPGNNGISVSSWFRSNANATNASLFTLGNDMTSSLNVYIQDNKLALNTMNNLYNTQKVLSSDPINDNSWNHLALTIQPSTTTPIQPSTNGMYACKLINTNYTGPIFNLRRSSDNATQNFYVDTTGVNITTGSGGTGTTLLNWFGGSLGSLITSKPPWGIYNAADYNTTTKVLPEAGGNTARNATSSGGAITKSSASGNGATASIPYIAGGTTSKLTWPAGSIPTNFTLCSISRFSGLAKNRVITSSDINLSHGHKGSRGLAEYNGVWKNQTSIGTATDWLVFCGNNGPSVLNSILADGVAVGKASGGGGGGALCINNDPYVEYSDWEFSYLMIWNQVLSDNEMLTVSNALQNYLLTGTLTTSLYVTKWYDQSTNANDASQNVVSSQPVFNPTNGYVDFSYYIWNYPFYSDFNNYASGIAAAQGYIVPASNSTCGIEANSLVSGWHQPTDNSTTDYFKLPNVNPNLKGYTFCFRFYILIKGSGMIFSLQDGTTAGNTNRICVYYNYDTANSIDSIQIGTVSTALYTVFTSPVSSRTYFFVWKLDTAGNSTGYIIDTTNQAKTTFSFTSSQTPYRSTLYTNNRLLSDSNNGRGASMYLNTFYYVDGILSQTELDAIYSSATTSYTHLTYRYLNLPDGTVPYNNSHYTVITKHGDVNSIIGTWLGSGSLATSNCNVFRVNNAGSAGSQYCNYWYTNDFFQGTYRKDNIVTYIYNGSSISLYINNTFVSSVNRSGRTSTRYNNAIGKSPYSPSNYEYLNGQLYYLYISPEALSDANRNIIETTDISYSNVNYYLNGSLKATLNNQFLYPYITNWTQKYLGKSNSTNNQQFYGNIDEFRVYNNQILTSAQVSSIYNQDSSANVNYNFTNSNVYIVYPDSVDISNPLWGKTNSMGINKTYYYWNDPYAYTSTLKNTLNPVIFSYTYNNTTGSSMTAKMYVIIDDDIGKVRQNGTIISNGPFTWNIDIMTPITVTLTTGNNLFEFLCTNGGGPACLAVYCSKTNQYDASPSNLSNYYPLKNGSQNSNLTLTNATIINLRKNGTLYFNGNSQYAQISSSSSAFSVTNSGLSFSFWFNFTSVAGKSWARVFDFGNGVDSDNIIYSPYGGYAVKRTNLIYFQPNGTDGDNCSGREDGKWHHMVWTMTYVSSATSFTSAWNVYMDNVNIYTTNVGLYPAIGTRTYNYIGKSNYAADAYATGYISDFRIYNGVYTSSEVTTLYNENYDYIDCLFSTNATKEGWTANVNGLFEKGCQLSTLL